MLSSNKITILSLRHLHLSHKEISVICQVLESNVGILSLDLHGNVMDAVGATSLSQSLSRCHSLRQLDLGGNQEFNNNIGVDGAAALSRALQSHTSLELLHLSYNNLSPDGIRELYGLISRSSRLKSLDLEGNVKDVGNRLGQISCLHTWKLISSCTNLTDLNISENGFLSRGQQSVKKALSGSNHELHQPAACI
ncbi:hypothetical protein GUITHDRAFT_113027 [Guillardia theta CCMP2712]|uniref:Uncharacterized protein n=1 Tax=Guillardia theta (strain CCMP2712) TaxID=905079 RepID=L1IYW3_GUITC|nr:hypothetical protein GUITHDRAFT_113027 [Guillardia theta CCMP2712]EKX41020.1 hypothetical protein GUITHDRAFT_113027 [Guillardia theta CCMP2712]|eukprot:XP_005828000.1 hypothetical protein GUITHDRAFT_113027 [Guillardia theta CCMP2712]